MSSSASSPEPRRSAQAKEVIVSLQPTVLEGARSLSISTCTDSISVEMSTMSPGPSPCPSPSPLPSRTPSPTPRPSQAALTTGILAILQELYQQKAVLACHVGLYLSVGFASCFLSLSHGHFSCISRMPPMQLFWTYFAFHAAFFLGTTLSAVDEYRILFVCAATTMFGLWLASMSRGRDWALAGSFSMTGLALGTASSTLNVSFIAKFPQEGYILANLLHIGYAVGVFVASVMFRSTSVSTRECAQAVLQSGYAREFSLIPVVNHDVVHFLYAIVQVALMFLMITRKKPSSASGNNQRRPADYEDLEQAKWDGDCVRLVLLCASIVCIANALFTLFPFFLFTQANRRLLDYQIFTGFFVVGRIATLFASFHAAPYFILGISIIGCGMSCCWFVFDEFFELGAATFGFFVAAFLPSMLVYLKQSVSLSADTLYVLISGASFGNLVYPLFLTQSPQTGSRAFIAVNFFAVLVLLLLYVCMLNVQAQQQRTKASQDQVKVFIDRFFSGENMLKRTRSIRPLISRLRPNSYRKLRTRRANRANVPKIEVTIEKEPQIIPF